MTRAERRSASITESPQKSEPDLSICPTTESRFSAMHVSSLSGVGLRRRLTDRQRRILEFVAASLRDRGMAPTLREIGERFGIRSTNGVNDHLRALERKGAIVREDMAARAIRLTGAGRAELEPVAVQVPAVPCSLCGRV